jgi:hypothetical protein
MKCRCAVSSTENMNPRFENIEHENVMRKEERDARSLQKCNILCDLEFMHLGP